MRAARRPDPQQIRRARQVLIAAGDFDVVLGATETAAAVGVSPQTIWNWQLHIGAAGADPHLDRRWVSLRRLRAFLQEHWHGNVAPGVADRLADFERDQSRWRLMLPPDDRSHQTTAGAIAAGRTRAATPRRSARTSRG
jgi:hypothetical protein